MTKMAGVPQTNPPFAKNTFFVTLTEAVYELGYLLLNNGYMLRVAIPYTRNAESQASCEMRGFLPNSPMETLTIHPTIGTPLASYRLGFGPPARNRKNIENGLPQKIRKNNPKNRKMAPKPYFRAIFPIFGLFFPYFLGAAVSYIFPIFFLFRAGGPKPIL